MIVVYIVNKCYKNAVKQTNKSEMAVAKTGKAKRLTAYRKE